MKSYSTLIFDAFDTVIHIERTKLPEHRIGGALAHSTAPRVYETYVAEDKGLAFEAFLRAFLESSAEAYRRRRSNLKEISSADRFRIMLELLGNRPTPLSPDLPERLAQTHMRTFQPALQIHYESQQLLEWAQGEGYRLAMISNFDYSPTLYDCLDRYRVREMFDVVVVSDEIGWRKPHPAIFEHALKRLGVSASDILFIGDRLDIDVDGAARSGMDAVWIDTGREVWSDQHARPRFTIGSLGELRQVLDGGMPASPGSEERDTLD